MKDRKKKFENLLFKDTFPKNPSTTYYTHSTYLLYHDTTKALVQAQQIKH